MARRLPSVQLATALSAGAVRAPASTPALLPVTLTATERQVNPLTPSAEESPCCELVLPAGTLRISGKLTPELLRMLIQEMQGECR